MKASKLCISLTLSMLFSAAAITAGARQDKGGEIPRTGDLKEASALSRRVVGLYNQQKHEEALPLAKRAVEVRRKLSGEDHVAVADDLINLGTVQMALKKYADAESSLSRALQIYEKAFGSDNPALYPVLERLGWANWALGRERRTEDLFLRSVAIREKALGPDHPEVGTALGNLGRFYLKAANYDRSIASLKRALAIAEKELGPKDKRVADLLEECACAYRQVDRQMEATGLEIQARSIRAQSSEDLKRAQSVSTRVLQGQAIRRVEPAYPAAARRARISGTVVVELLIDESGSVTRARAICGPDLLVNAAVDAARRWRFSPTMVSGSPVKVIGTVIFNFRM